LLDADNLQRLAVQVLNISLMLSVGLELDPRELLRVLKRRRLLLGGVLANFAVVPLVTWLLVESLPVTGAVSAGLLLAAYAPGGGTGTLLTRLGHGALEVSVVLLVVLTTLAVALTPALASATLGGRVDGAELSLGPLLRTLLVFQLAPLVAGLLLRRNSEGLARKLDRLARPLSNFVFVALVLGLIVTKGHTAVDVGAAGGVAILGSVVTALGLPLLAPVPRTERAALSLTTGVRNLSLALLLSSTFFPDDATTVAVLTHGLVMYLVAVPLAFVLRPPRSAAAK
jgi:BASS family bile acid:Na+ symporter